MKNLMTTIIAAAALTSVAANLAGVIDGTNSYSAAAYSGYHSGGNYNVAVGNSSFRSAKGDGNVALGAISMGCSTGCVNSVMVGPWAGYGARDMNGCAFAVAALVAMRGASLCAWIRRDGLLVLSLPDAEAEARAADIERTLKAQFRRLRIETSSSRDGTTTWQYAVSGLSGGAEKTDGALEIVLDDAAGRYSK